MIRKIFFVLIAIALTVNIFAQPASVYNRSTIPLDGDWHYLIDPMETGYYDYRFEPKSDGFFLNQKVRDKTELLEYDFAAAPVLQVPGDWNSQNPELLWYEGAVWYEKDFEYRKTGEKRLFLHFGAVNYEAKVYVNGQKAGEHTGGFTPFSFEITDLVNEGDNFVVVKVNNTRRLDGIPTVNSDWWNYGGITRSVVLVETPRCYIDDYRIQLAKGSLSEITVGVNLSEKKAGVSVMVEIPELKIKQKLTTDAKGYAQSRFSTIDSLFQLWSPENPKLYAVEMVAGEDVITDRIGFRSIETRGRDILLNGKPVFLRGTCIHEENPLRGGRAHSMEDARLLLGWAKEMGCNFVRLAHYPHNENMIREAEKMGLLVWSEIPLYWTIQWQIPSVFENAKNQFSEMFRRDKNRAAVILWSLANETPLGDARLQFLTGLARYVRNLDDTRLLTAALETHTEAGDPNTIIVNDPLGEYLDVLGCNEYLGWYGDALPAESPSKIWKTIYDKPLIMSEFGAGALAGKHGGKTERWTEEFQASFFEENIAMLKNIPFLRGATPWILVDFRSPKRPLTGIQDYYNRKGLISEKGEKKQAFFVMQKFYSDLFLDPDNERIAAVDTFSKLYVPVKRITANPDYHWFAYYDKLETDPSNRYVLSMSTPFEGRSPVPEDVIGIGTIDLQDNNRWIPIGESRAWGWQQGCQLQFLPHSKNEIVWNDKEGDHFVCHIYNIETQEKRTIPRPIYALAPDGKWAVTTDYRRVNDTRPGYGYAGIPDPYSGESAPDSSGIWKIDMQTGEARLIISIAQVAAMENPYDTETRDAKHWFNHLLVNPDGTRFIFLHRWRYPDAERSAKYTDVGGWGTRMLTAAADGSDIRIIDPYNYTSHFIWRDANHILAWTHLPERGDGFYLFEDAAAGNIEQIGKDVMLHNGHCTYLPGHNNEWILNDTYPDPKTRLQSVYLYHVPTGKRIPLADFYSPAEYKGEWRCDTHPRSSQDGNFVIVDSPNWDGRQLYILDIRKIISDTH